MRSGTLTAKHSLLCRSRPPPASDIRILARHVLPSTASSIIVLASMRLALLLAGAGLSFIGLAQPPQPEWGAPGDRSHLPDAALDGRLPGLAITLTVVGFLSVTACARTRSPAQ